MTEHSRSRLLAVLLALSLTAATTACTNRGGEDGYAAPAGPGKAFYYNAI
jgi:hypothetical protein